MEMGRYRNTQIVRGTEILGTQYAVQVCVPRLLEPGHERRGSAICSNPYHPACVVNGSEESW
jgi:hypothetical protein